jgi:hypothetical protein
MLPATITNIHQAFKEIKYMAHFAGVDMHSPTYHSEKYAYDIMSQLFSSGCFACRFAQVFGEKVSFGRR